MWPRPEWRSLFGLGAAVLCYGGSLTRSCHRKNSVVSHILLMFPSLPLRGISLTCVFDAFILSLICPTFVV